MSALSILDEVVSILENDVNAQRIKRLILFACKEIWENDSTVLERTDLREIIRNLCIKFSQVEDIEAVLNSIVSKVNKKTEYALIATTIITQITRLYEEEDTEVETTISNSFAFQVPTYFVEPLNSTQPAETEEQEEEELNKPGYLFDVRQKILQQTNPLRAKILIFSTLYHEFSFSERDWSLLKTQELDHLLRQLLNACPTLTELESQLYRTANHLDNSDENAQAASVIIQAMTNCYIQGKQEPDRAESINDQGYEDTHLMNNVFQETTLTNDVGYFEDGEITMMGQGAAGNFYYNPQASQLWPAHTTFSPGDDTQTSDPDATSELIPPHLTTYHISESVESQEDSHQSVAAAINISDSIKQKLDLEEEIKALVSESSNIVMTTVERTLSELEVDLDRQVANENIEEKVVQKYKALRDFIGNVEEFTSKLIQILSQLESAERQRLNLHNPNPNSPEKEPQNPNHGKINQQRLVELARQGNPKAIAVLLNQFLQPKGINAMALLRDGCFHILLESAQVPNREVTAKFVQNKLAGLKSKSITHVKVHGRQSGNKSVAWTQEVLNPSS
ncbi:hypothetical protein [Kamptonema sp. UHCC 0994]|uniref:hypothetical protein n=1 Tax=Kamptonema sp. UHCC 0994 TaxID=3031329 RepID=UPI0023B8EE0D|nr:hypothetical protein [Kamptonema sp. UHCC 0994]MDF0552558.1 hypothetical protein [Kamptonema sp. UHCC 0994]